MATNQEKLDYIVAPSFKRDMFAGSDPLERSGRASFVGELLNHGVPLGNPADGKVTSLRDFLQWNASGINNIYTLLTTVRNDVAALREEVRRMSAT